MPYSINPIALRTAKTLWSLAVLSAIGLKEKQCSNAEYILFFKGSSQWKRDLCEKLLLYFSGSKRVLFPSETIFKLENLLIGQF